jgi:hypothetical protein
VYVSRHTINIVLWCTAVHCQCCLSKFVWACKPYAWIKGKWKELTVVNCRYHPVICLARLRNHNVSQSGWLVHWLRHSRLHYSYSTLKTSPCPFTTSTVNWKLSVHTLVSTSTEHKHVCQQSWSLFNCCSSVHSWCVVYIFTSSACVCLYIYIYICN